MINAGFNPLQQISEKTGKSISQLKEEMSKGAISAEMVQQAFLDATSAGGKFYNMSENASKTINGQISMMQDAMDAAFNEIGTKTEGIIINSIKAATSLIQNYEKIGKVLVGLVTTYGVYRTAVIVATAAEKGLTVAELALTKARVIAKKAQDALNASMMTNPYVALAVVVAGLVASMWALRDSTSAAEKAQKRFNDIKEKAAQKEQEHKDAIQGLIEKVRDDTRAITERESAMIALRNQYPSIFARYDTESLKLANLIDLNKQLNEEMSLRARADAKNRITTQEDVIRKMERLGVSKERLDAEVKVLQDFQKDYLMQYSLPDYVSSLKNLDLDKLQEELGGAKFMASGSGVGIYDGMQADKKFYESMVAAIEAEIKSRESVKKFYSDDYEAAKKKYEEDYAAFKWAEENKTKVTTKEYQNRKAAMEASEKEFKKLGGDPNEIKKENEKAGQQERLDSMTEKNAKENARAAKDMEFKVWQARIDAMKEGAAKTRAQRQLDYEKELENLERQKQDYILKVVEQEKAIFDAKEEANAKGKKDYKKKVFDTDAAAAKVDASSYDAAIKGATAKYLDNEEQVYEALFEQYMSFTDQKKKLEKEYLEDVLELNMAYLETGDEKYVRSIDERTKAYAQSLNKINKAMNADDYKLIFGDTNKMTTKGIEMALSKAKDLLSTMSKDTDPETWKVVIEKISELEDVKLNRLFEGWDSSTTGLLQQLMKVQEMKAKIEKKEMSGDDMVFKKAKEDLRKSFVATGATLFGDTLSQAAAHMREIAEISGDVDLADKANTLASAASIISSTASGFASGGLVGGTVGFFSGAVSSAISSIFNGDAEVERSRQRAKQALEDYEDSIARLARTFSEEDYDTIFGVRSLSKVAKASEMASKAWEDYMNAMHVESRKMGPLGVYTSKTVLGLEKMDTFFNDGSRWLTLRELLPQIFEYEENARGGYDVIGLKLDEAKAALTSYSEYASHEWYKALEDAVAALEAYETQVAIVDDQLKSLFSNIGSGIVDSIMKGEDALEAIKKSTGDVFAQISKQLVSEMLMSEEFITKYTEKWRKALATADNGVDDADLMAEMADELAKNVEDAKAFYEQLKRTAEERGIDMDIMSESQQEASRRGYETLSEDTGNELVGRALAQYESNLRMEEATRGMKDSIDLMASNYIQIKNIAEESRTLIAHSYLELQQIRDNTGAIIRPIQNLSEKIDKWDSKIMDL